MGLGWMILGDGQTRWHNGQTGGSHAALFINRKLNCAVVVLSNTAVANEVDQLAIQMIMKAAGLEVKSELGKKDSAPPKLSPFTDVRFEDERVIVDYEDQTYQRLELNGIKVEDIVSSKKQFGWQWSLSKGSGRSCPNSVRWVPGRSGDSNAKNTNSVKLPAESSPCS